MGGWGLLGKDTEVVGLVGVVVAPPPPALRRCSPSKGEWKHYGRWTEL